MLSYRVLRNYLKRIGIVIRCHIIIWSVHCYTSAFSAKTGKATYILNNDKDFIFFYNLDRCVFPSSSQGYGTPDPTYRALIPSWLRFFCDLHIPLRCANTGLESRQPSPGMMNRKNKNFTITIIVKNEPLKMSPKFGKARKRAYYRFLSFSYILSLWYNDKKYISQYNITGYKLNWIS